MARTLTGALKQLLYNLNTIYSSIECLYAMEKHFWTEIKEIKKTKKTIYLNWITLTYSRYYCNFLILYEENEYLCNINMQTGKWELPAITGHPLQIESLCAWRHCFPQGTESRKPLLYRLRHAGSNSRRRNCCHFGLDLRLFS